MSVKPLFSFSQGQADLLKHANGEALDTLRQIHCAAHSCGLAKNGASTSPASPLLPPHARPLHTIHENETDNTTLHWDTERERECVCVRVWFSLFICIWEAGGLRLRESGGSGCLRTHRRRFHFDLCALLLPSSVMPQVFNLLPHRDIFLGLWWIVVVRCAVAGAALETVNGSGSDQTSASQESSQVQAPN